jgi:lysyl-tRNA synthetase, class II
VSGDITITGRDILEQGNRLQQIAAERQQKIDRLKAIGVDSYPNRYRRSHTAAQAVTKLEKADAAGKTVNGKLRLAGRLIARRGMGKISFLDIRDHSGKIQFFVTRQALNETGKEILKNIDIGDFIGGAGKLFRTRSGEPTLEVTELTMLSKSLQPLPEKWHGLADVDIRHRQRYLDLIANPEVMDTFVTRSRIITAVRAYLDKQGFMEVDTPVLQPAAGGATARPFITHHNTLDNDFFLRIALELHLKRLIVGGFDKVYEMGPIFRNEGLSVRHNPEFTMMECYEAYADYNDVMDNLEKMVVYVCRQVRGGMQSEFGGDTIDFTPPWPRLKLRETTLKYSGLDYDAYPDAAALGKAMAGIGMEVDPKKSRGKLIDELVSSYVEPNIVQPTFLIDYPVDLSPLAKNCPGDPKTVERFEVIVGHMELANAFTELNDPVEQEKRFTEQLKERAAGDDEVPEIDHDFITALRHGMPPTGGLGVGIDRLVMLLTGQDSIREVILFPQLRDKE